MNDLNDIIIVNKNNPKPLDNNNDYLNFYISNKTIRINTFDSKENNKYDFYIYNSQNDKGSYTNLKSIYDYDISIIDYMNNHNSNMFKRNYNNTPFYIRNLNIYKNISYQLNTRFEQQKYNAIRNEVKEYKDINDDITKGRNQTFYYGIGNNYTNNSNEYGIPQIKKTTYNENNINQSKIKYIPDNENIYGELYIALYIEILNNNEQYKNIMFMNGKDNIKIDTIKQFKELVNLTKLVNHKYKNRHNKTIQRISELDQISKS